MRDEWTFLFFFCRLTVARNNQNELNFSNSREWLGTVKSRNLFWSCRKCFYIKKRSLLSIVNDASIFPLEKLPITFNRCRIFSAINEFCQRGTKSAHCVFKVDDEKIIVWRHERIAVIIEYKILLLQRLELLKFIDILQAFAPQCNHDHYSTYWGFIDHLVIYGSVQAPRYHSMVLLCLAQWFSTQVGFEFYHLSKSVLYLNTLSIQKLSMESHKGYTILFERLWWKS